MPVEGAFSFIADGEGVPAQGAVIVSLARFTRERGLLLGRAQPLGLRLEASESPEALGADIHKFALIVLNVPYFRDGRVSGHAAAHDARYKGEIAHRHVCGIRLPLLACRVAASSPRPMTNDDVRPRRPDQPSLPAVGDGRERSGIWRKAHEPTAS